MPASKLRNATAEQESECALDMSPMIDMVFLLLIFFIVNATAIVVKTDPKVEPPVADNAKEQTAPKGRIVINVRKDGKFTTEDLTELEDAAQITDWVKKQKERNESLGIAESRLHLRGDKNAVFEHGRTAIRAAAEAGVIQVLFGVYQRPYDN